MGRLRLLLLALPLALAPGCVVAGDVTPVGGYGYSYGYGYGRPYYAPPPRWYAPAPVYRPYYPSPRPHWGHHWRPPHHGQGPRHWRGHGHGHGPRHWR